MLEMGILLDEYPTTVLVPPTKASQSDTRDEKGIDMKKVAAINKAVTNLIINAKNIFFPDGVRKKVWFFQLGKVGAIIKLVIDLYNDISDILDPGSPNL